MSEKMDTVTIITCGPSTCEHDYSGPGIEIDGGGWTAVCVKCGTWAINETAWGDVS